MKLETQDPVLSQNGEDEDDAGSCSELDEPDTIEEWQSVVDLIKAKTKEAFESSPHGAEFSVEAFQSYWRNVFQHLAASVSTSPSIPTFVTSPPVKKFTITLFDAGHEMGCPCCLPDAEPNIVAENENGVTKDDVMKAFVNYMYGATLPTIYLTGSQRIHKASSENACALVYSADWMSSGDGDSGKRIAYVSYMDLDERVPNIFMYCCGPEKFGEKLEEDEMKAQSKL